jgi:hypothetical protein
MQQDDHRAIGWALLDIGYIENASFNVLEWAETLR